MSQGRRILLVAQSTTLASTLLTWLGDTQELVIANTFAAAKHHLTTRPDLLIAEVKLGDQVTTTDRSPTRAIASCWRWPSTG